MASPVSSNALSELIGSIYDCALDPDLWDKTLASVVEALKARTTVLHLNDLRHRRFLISKQFGIPPYWQENLHKYASELDSVVSSVISSQAPGKPCVMSRHFAQAQLEASPYYNECLKPEGIVDLMQFVLLSTPTRASGWAVSRHECYGTFTDGEIQLAELLLPHIRRAVTISNVLDVRTIRGARMEQALDALRCGVVMTDERGTILHANHLADHMLQNGSPVHSSQGTLRARVPAAHKELRAAIRLAAHNGEEIGSAGTAIVLTETGQPPIFAHVLPMARCDIGTRLKPDAIAAVFIAAEPEEDDAAQMIAAAFGLTPAETRVLASLLAGRTLGQTAEALGVAQTTAKTHLEGIFTKTGVSRQADLMRLVARVMPPTRAG